MSNIYHDGRWLAEADITSADRGTAPDEAG